MNTVSSGNSDVDFNMRNVLLKHDKQNRTISENDEEDHGIPG